MKLVIRARVCTQSTYIKVFQAFINSMNARWLRFSQCNTLVNSAWAHITDLHNFSVAMGECRQGQCLLLHQSSSKTNSSSNKNKSLDPFMIVEVVFFEPNDSKLVKIR